MHECHATGTHCPTSQKSHTNPLTNTSRLCRASTLPKPPSFFLPTTSSLHDSSGLPTMLLHHCAISSPRSPPTRPSRTSSGETVCDQTGTERPGSDMSVDVLLLSLRRRGETMPHNSTWLPGSDVLALSHTTGACLERGATYASKPSTDRWVHSPSTHMTCTPS